MLCSAYPRKIFSFLIFGLLLQACSQGGQVSEAERRALQSVALSQSFNVHERVGDVYSSVDAIPDLVPFM